MEWLDIVDSVGEPVGAVVERSAAHRYGVPHRTAHVWLFRKEGDKVEILLQKRSDNKDSYPGCWDISSAGHIPAGVDYIPSALRELSEELGLTVSEDALHYCGWKRMTARDNFRGIPYLDRQVTRIYALWYTPDMGDFRLQAEEIADVQWMEFRECIRGVDEGAFDTCIDLWELRILAAWMKK